MPSTEQIFGGNLRGPLLTETGQSNAWSGRTVVPSGSTTVTVSTSIVRSDSVILTGFTVASGAAATSSGGVIAVQSIVDSVSFAFMRQNAAAVPRDETVMWLIVNQRR